MELTESERATLRLLADTGILSVIYGPMIVRSAKRRPERQRG